MTADFHRTVASLDMAAQQAANRVPDRVATLVDQIKLATKSNADPYLLIGALAEGAVQALIQRIPAERQPDTSAALVQIIMDRLRDEGLRSP